MYIQSDLDNAFDKLNKANEAWERSIYVDDGQAIYRHQTTLHECLDNYLKIKRWLVDDTRASDAEAFKTKKHNLTKRKTLFDKHRPQANANKHFKQSWINQSAT